MPTKHLFERIDHVLMSFEGPICAAVPKDTMADRLRVLLEGAKLPLRVANTPDPMVVLRDGTTYGLATARALHKQLTALEYAAVSAAGVTARHWPRCATWAPW